MRRTGGARCHRRHNCHGEHPSALTCTHPAPAPPAEFQPHPQPPMLIRAQGIRRYTLALPQPAPGALKAHHHQPRQGHAVPAQPHRLPATTTGVHLPAAHITAQAGNGLFMGQQNTAGKRPGSVGKAGNDEGKRQPGWQRACPRGKPGYPLACQVDSQQPARALPAALITLTWAGHGPE